MIDCDFSDAKKKSPELNAVGLILHPQDCTTQQYLQSAALHLFGSEINVKDLTPTDYRVTGDGNCNKGTDMEVIQAIEDYERTLERSSKEAVVDIVECNRNCGTIPKVYTAKTDGGIQSVVRSFKTLYSAGVRYFHVSQSEEIMKNLCAFIEKFNVHDVVIVSPLINLKENCENIIALRRSTDDYLIESLFTNQPAQTFLPIISTSQSEMLQELIATGRKYNKTLTEPIHFNFSNISAIADIVKTRQNNFRGRLAVLIVAGDLVTDVFSSQVLVDSLQSMTTLLLSDPVNLRTLQEQPAALSGAAKLSVTTVVPFSEETKPFTSTVTSLTKGNILFSPGIEYNSMIALLSLLGENVSYPDELRTLYHKLVNPHNKNNVSTLRLIMLPENTPGLHYAIDSPWFMESIVTKMTQSENNQMEAEYIPYKLMNVASPVKHCDSNDVFIRFHSEIIAFARNIQNVSATDVFVIPDIKPRKFDFFHVCHKEELAISELNCHEETEYLVNCGSLAETNEEIDRDFTSLMTAPPSFMVAEITNNNSFFYLHDSTRATGNNTGFEKRADRTTRAVYSYDEYTALDRWENFKAIFPQMLGCMGSCMGCWFCFIFLMYTTVHISTGVCMGACGVAVGGSCGTLAALGYQRMLHQTVICTELFQQGYMSREAYLADAKFGLRLNRNHPEAMKMYRTLAKPVVRLMQQSNCFTEVVYFIATPLLKHMEYVEGLEKNDNFPGWILYKFSILLLELIASWKQFMSNYSILSVLITLIFISLWVLKKRVMKLKYL